MVSTYVVPSVPCCCGRAKTEHYLHWDPRARHLTYGGRTWGGDAYLACGEALRQWIMCYSKFCLGPYTELFPDTWLLNYQRSEEVLESVVFVEEHAIYLQSIRAEK